MEQLNFDQVMQLINTIGDQEKHFNQLETEYRKLASTWLLAALGACGYVLNSNPIISFDKWYIIMGICLSSSVGIGILYIMDLKVYHHLLDSYFTERLKLEKKYSEFLPSIGQNMLDSQKNQTVISRLLFYYLISITLLLLLTIVAIFNLHDLADKLLIKIILIVVIIITIFFLYLWMDGDTVKAKPDTDKI